MQDHAAQDVDVEEAKRTDAAIAAVIETADPRDFEDDAGPAYADEDFEEEASSDADASGVEAAIEVLEAGETGADESVKGGVGADVPPAKNAKKNSKRGKTAKPSGGVKAADEAGSAKAGSAGVKAGSASAAGGAGGKADGAGAGAKVDAAAGASATGTKGATGAKGAKVDSVKASGKTAANDAKADAAKRAGETKDAKPGAVVGIAKTAGSTQLDGVKPVEAVEVVDPSSKEYWADIDRLQEKLPALDKFPERFVDRELTWIDFNKRVLEQAQDRNLPVLTRAWFLSIFSSNLDEFYMVRVAGLKRRIAAGITPVRASGLDAKQVLELITSRAKRLTAAQAELFQNDVRPAMAQAGIEITDWKSLNQEERDKLTRYFRYRVYPVLTPLAVDPSHPFPYISGLSLNLAVMLRNPRSGKNHFARIKLPDSLPRFVQVPGRELTNAKPRNLALIPLEEVVAYHLDHLFPGMEIVEHHVFRVTRNENLEVEEDDAENLLTAMEKELGRRRFGRVVRLEVEDSISEFVRTYLVRKLNITQEDVFVSPAPLNLSDLSEIHDLDIPEFKYKRYVPVTPAGINPRESARPRSIFAAIREHNILLHHPYDAFSTSVQEFISQAAHDPKVLAIKQTLYRTSGDSPIVDALIEAAELGKQVVAIVEIKARFDEEANIVWARKLERAGVHVVYGMIGLKTHCKLSLVVRQETDGLRRYCHVGTGNYHPKTARGYEDLGLLTCDRDVAQDLTTLFNQLSGYAPRARFRRLLVAPRGLRNGLLERIKREIDNHLAGREAWIKIKVNSIVDERIIDALYRASRAGVRVDLVVRGICGIRSGVEGLSENIHVTSILGRYLEHSRIYAFANDGDPEIFIGSADLMHRNLDRRVEALVKITQPDLVERLHWLIDLETSGRISAWHLLPDGTWQRRTHDDDGQELEDVQNVLMSQARARVK